MKKAIKESTDFALDITKLIAGLNTTLKQKRSGIVLDKLTESEFR